MCCFINLFEIVLILIELSCCIFFSSCCIFIQVYAEFRRITNQNLPNTFYAELDRHLPRLMTIFRQKASKTGETADALAEILKNHDKQVNQIFDISSLSKY